MQKTAITILTAAALAAPAAMAQMGTADYPTYEPPASVRNGYTADDLMNANVRGTGGTKIGGVDDLVIGPDGQIRRLIVGVDGNMFGIGDRPLAVKWSEADVYKDDNGDIKYILVPVSNENVGEHGIFKDKTKAVEGQAREWRANELIGDYVDLKDYEYYGSVTDLMFDKDGKLQAISATPDRQGAGATLYAHYNNDGWEPGDANYVIPYSRSELANLLPKEMSEPSEMSADGN